MFALPHTADPTPARIQCARCYRYLPVDAFYSRQYKRTRKDGTVSRKTYRMRICIVCQRELDVLRKLPLTEKQPYAEIGAIVTRLVPLPEGGFAAYDYHGNWLADGESAISIIAALYQEARKHG